MKIKKHILAALLPLCFGIAASAIAEDSYIIRAHVQDKVENPTETLPPVYSNWVYVGEEHSCTEFAPHSDTITKGEKFTQTKQCLQDVERDVTITVIDKVTSEVISTTTTLESDKWTIDHEQEAIGTMDCVTRAELRAMIVGGEDVTKVDVSCLTDFSYVADTPGFNQDISGWDVSSGKHFSGMFYKNTSFNQNISGWNMSNATDISMMFHGATSFNTNLSNWNTSNVTRCEGVFMNATSFNQPLSGWSLPNCNSFANFFSGAAKFNQPIGNWKVSGANSFQSMFRGAKAFNQSLNGWKMNSALNISYMFDGADSFNKPLDGWDVSKVTTFNGVFQNNKAFNQNISEWNTSSAKSWSFFRKNSVLLTVNTPTEFR